MTEDERLRLPKCTWKNIETEMELQMKDMAKENMTES